MATEFQDSMALLEAARTEKLYTKVIVQLQKDFERANIEIDLSGELLPLQLKDQLHQKLYYLILEKFEEYLNLMYIIDVPEKAFKQLALTDVVEVAGQMTYLVLKRELQKVRLKAKYA